MTASSGASARKFSFTFGQSETQTVWTDRRALDWLTLTDWLTRHERGSKEGSCLVPAVFSGTRRLQDEAEQIDLVVLDADAGHSIEEIEAAIGARGWAAIIHSTHSHLTTRTRAKKSHWTQFCEIHPASDPREFLTQKKHYLPHVAEGAQLLAVNGVDVTFEHAPCPKYRIVLPLAQAWRAADYPSREAASAAWKERIEALAAALGLQHDQSCVDANRLFYLPRHPGDGREPIARVLDGADCDIWALPAAAGGKANTDDAGLFNGRHDAGGIESEFADPGTGEIIDLRDWAREYGARFELVKALRAKRPSVFVGYAKGEKHHIQCPNDDQHTESVADRATFVVNASDANNKGFAVHCRHAHCTGLDRLGFVRKMLEAKWLKIEDLTAAEFLTTKSDDPAETSASEWAQWNSVYPEGAPPHKTPSPLAGDDWPEPLDFLADADLTGAPELRPEHLPEAIAPFVFDTAARMGADPAAVALCALVALSSVMSDEWRIQPKAYDHTWTENPRLWGAIVGDPSIRKTPVLKATTAPIDRMEAEARERHEEAMRDFRRATKKWKEGAADLADEPKHPRLDRYMVEGATTEALSEALRDDAEAKQRAPVKKVLIRQDEMSEWVASFDCYRAGGRGGADRGSYLRLYNGGRFTIDRVNRGAFAVPNWSACVLGGIQPGPIRKIAKDAADDGLLQRFCYCVPGRQGRDEDRTPDADAIARYAALFPALAALRPSRSFTDAPQPVVLHADAHPHRLAVLDFAEALAAMPDASDRLKSALGKWPGLWARLTLVFHLIGMADAAVRGEQQDIANVASEAAVSATAYLRDILLPHLLRAEAVMFSTDQTGHARWIAGFILSKAEARISARDIMRAYGALRPPERRRELIDIMVSLEAMGWVRSELPTDGRPPVAWAVNPKVHTSFAERAKRERAEREAVKARIRETLAQHMKHRTAA